MAPFNQGLINNGNTCHTNALLQVFNVMPTFWQCLASDTPNPPPLISTLLDTIVRLRSSTKAIDPSRFLDCLQTTIRGDGNTLFAVNAQQDAADVLRYIL